MNLNDEKLNDFLEKIEKMKRNKINNYSFVEQFHYVDPNGYISKLDANIDHVIFGRRGSGKTTLLQKSVKRHDSKNHCILLDCEMLKEESKLSIVITIVEKIASEIQSKIDYERLAKLKRDNYFDNKFITKYFKKKEERKITMEKYRKEYLVSEISKILSDKMSNLSKTEDVIEFDYEQIQKNKSKSSTSKDSSFKIDSNMKLDTKIKDSLLTLESAVNIAAESNYSISHQNEQEIQTLTNLKQRKVIKKKEIIDSLKLSLIELMNNYHIVYDKRIVFFLDDFYYIKRDNQPYVLNYIHQLNKNGLNDSFSFKLSALPNRFKMNYDNQFDLSIKDDFSSISLDRDLSDIKVTKEFLLDISSALVENKITPKEFEDIFSTKEVLNYAIVACGGNPREFLILFERLIRYGRKHSITNIGKTMVYSIVYDTIEEKENSIEDDEVISKDKVLEAVGYLKRDIVIEKNTNVFLYPQELYEKHNIVLKSLIAFGYIHQLKESIVSDYHSKKTFVPFCIDMSLYVTESSMKRKFDFKQFWVRDEKSRLINIVKSPTWNLPENFF